MLESLAFCAVNDAVSLTTRDEISVKELKKLDLSCISEIKQSKGGGFEIKFIDRLKALELLLNYESRYDKLTDAGSLYDALAESAKMIGSFADGDPDAV